MNLLDQLIQKQTELELSNRAFARRLRISHGMWIETRKGVYPIRFQVLAAAAREFPSLNDAILKYLAAHNRDGAAIVLPLPTEPVVANR